MPYKLQEIHQDRLGGRYLVLGEDSGPWEVTYSTDDTFPPYEDLNVYRGEPRKASRIACMRSRLALDHPHSETARHLKEHF